MPKVPGRSSVSLAHPNGRPRYNASMQMIMSFFAGIVRAIRNLWRGIRRRRIDWVRITVRGALPELADAPPWWQRRLMGASAPLSLLALRRRLERLADDAEIRGVLLTVEDLSAGWAAIEGLHEALRTYRDAGKRVVAYLPTADSRAYLAACAADAVVMPPTAYLNLTGVRVEATFLGDALRLAGLDAEVIAVSPYKSGGDSLARGTISPEAREQLERLVDARFAALVGGIAAARGLEPARVRELIDRAPLLAADARAAGLLDAALYEDELESFLAGLGGDPEAKLKIVTWRRAERVLALPPARRERRYVGVVRVEGAISAGRSRRSPLPLPLIGGSQAGSDSIIKALRRAEGDRRVAALVLHVDSPGGDAFASDLIWREALRLGRCKPLVVSMGDVAASGGYYIAAPARAIVARPSTLTGSIGVYTVRPNAAALLERAEIGVAAIARGANSGLYSPARPLDAAEREAIGRTVFEIYAAFKQRVSAGRSIPEERLEAIAGGRVWTGGEALELGLVDELGGFPAAVARARALAELPPDPRAPVLLIGGGGEAVPPRPFPATPPEPAPGALPALLEDALRTRVLAALPWLMRDL
jgi:protease-4